MLDIITHHTVSIDNNTFNVLEFIQRVLQQFEQFKN